MDDDEGSRRYVDAIIDAVSCPFCRARRGKRCKEHWNNLEMLDGVHRERLEKAVKERAWYEAKYDWENREDDEPF